MNLNYEQTKAKSKESDRLNSSLIFSLQILDYLEKHESPASLAEICKAIGIHKSRIMRLCGTMEHMGYILHLREEGVYALGPRLLSLGKAFERSNPLIQIVRPVLQLMVSELKETTSFQIVRDDKRLCLCAVESPYPVRYSMIEGSEGDFPYGASSKVLLAWGPEDLRERVFSHAPYKRYTQNTITTEEELRKSIEQAHAQGYVISFEDHSLGSAALAVPVFRSGNTMAGAICVSAVISRMSKDFMEQAIPYTIQKAAELSHMLGNN